VTHGKSPVLLECAIQDRCPCFAAELSILIVARYPLRMRDLNRQVKQVACQEQRHGAIDQDYASMAWRVARSVDHPHALDDLVIVGTEVEPALFLEHRHCRPPLEVWPIGGPGEERPIGRVYVVDGIAKLRAPVPSAGATSVVGV
jgi:hypothetical protein